MIIELIIAFMVMQGLITAAVVFFLVDLWQKVNEINAETHIRQRAEIWCPACCKSRPADRQKFYKLVYKEHGKLRCDRCGVDFMVQKTPGKP